ncbi:ABC transporter permease [Candidatus Woesearchaeota archaeon]|nr:ABC transporter permease [Candidatus Woesearchaeota archaeon]
MISSSLENAIVDQFDQAGANRIYVFPGTLIAGSFVSSLTDDDVETIENTPGVKWVQPYTTRPSEIEFANEKEFSNFMHSIPVKGLEERIKDTNFFDLEDGRLLTPNDKYAALVGWYIAHKAFDRGIRENDIRVNNNMLIAGTRFKVVGILAYKGTDDDKHIIIPEDTLKELFPEVSNEVSFIELKTVQGVDVEAIAAKIKSRLERKRNNDDFEVQTPENFLATLKSILLIVQIVLGSIAAISLVVGAIGIANSMFTSVLERTKEIGVMKSIGARNSDVLVIFILEAATLGIIGGVIGLSGGVAIALTVQNIAQKAGFGLLKVIVTWKIVAVGILFASLVGIAAGAIPAYRASKLRPVESLRA